MKLAVMSLTLLSPCPFFPHSLISQPNCYHWSRTLEIFSSRSILHLHSNSLYYLKLCIPVTTFSQTTLLSSPGNLLVVRELALSIHCPLIDLYEVFHFSTVALNNLPDSIYPSLNWSHFELAFLLRLPPVLFLLKAVTNLPIFIT